MSPEARLQWLVDRAEIAELLVAYARCIDRRDWSGLQETYTEDGVMDHGAVAVGRDGVPELSERILRDCTGSHHVVDSPSIVIDGDTAQAHCHYLATHLGGGEPPTVIRQGGGWYDCTLRRTDRGWRFTRVRATSAFRTGEPLRLE